MKWKTRVSVLLLSAATLLIIIRLRGNTKNKISPLIEVDDSEITLNHQRDLIAREYNSIDGQNDEHDLHKWSGLHSWDIWQEMVSARALTHNSEKYVGLILKTMTSAKILKANVGYKGTQLKAQFTLDGPEYQTVVFKPKRYERDKILSGTPYEGYDRHNAEIAAFHLDRILGFNRAPPAVGRYINISSEFIPVAKKRLLRTFFKDEQNNFCFYGVCMYCKEKEPACGKGSMMEGTLTLWLPAKWTVAKTRHPWQRTYNKRKAKWEADESYCDSVVIKKPYNKGPRLLDIMDTSIFDFIIGNADRHHYEYLAHDKNNGMLIHLDNGKSFGNPLVDETSILAPIYQCCRLRRGTYERLVKFSLDSNNASSLSSLLSKQLVKDPIFPILTQPHLSAIDRRLKIALETIRNCFKEKGKENVILEDGF